MSRSPVPAVCAAGLVKTYPSGRGAPPVRALDGLDLEVAAGSVVGLLGRNGAGKSTTVKILSTLARADAGTATVAGLDVARQSDAVRHRIGLVGQQASSDPMATGRENLLLAGRIHGMPRKAASARATELLATFDLGDAADRLAKTYSGGMSRRLDVAIGLVHRPQVLFLDEPTTGLDPESRTSMWDEIGRLRRDDEVTVLLTTHYLEEADALADRVAIVDAGRVVVEGTPEQLKNELRGDAVEVELVDRSGGARRGRAAHPRPGGRGRHRGRHRGARPRRQWRAARPVRARRPGRRGAGGARGPGRPPVAGRRVPAARRSRVPRGGGRVTALDTRLVGHAGLLTTRGVRTLLRQPAYAVITLVQPVIWLLLFGQLFRSVVQLPGFAPGTSYLEFLTPGVVMMTALFSSGWAGTVFIEDMERGVMDRLLASPVRRGALIAGTLAYQALTTVVQTAVVLALALASGARFPGGVAGVLVTALAAVLLSSIVAAFSDAMALLLRQQEALIGISQFIVLPLQFLSSAIMDVRLAPAWVQQVARYNPVDWAVVAARQALSATPDWSAVWARLGLLSATAVIFAALAARAFGSYRRSA